MPEHFRAQVFAGRLQPVETAPSADAAVLAALEREKLSIGVDPGQVKRAVDRDRRPGRFLLSGSANLSLLKGVSESLAGRAVYLTLRPFSLRELRGLTEEPAFLPHFFAEPRLPRSTATPLRPEDVLAGGLPPVALRQVRDRALWFRGFVQTYLERDVRDLAQVADLAAFRRFLQLAALRTGQVLNASELARDAQQSATTASRWLGLMETSFTVMRLHPFLGNRLRARRAQGPKRPARQAERRFRGRCEHCSPASEWSRSVDWSRASHRLSAGHVAASTSRRRAAVSR